LSQRIAPLRTVLREYGGFVYPQSNLSFAHYDIQFHNKILSAGNDDVLLIAIAWVYVVGMVAVVEATSSNGTILGAVFTLLLYGVLPLAIVGYLFLTPARRRLQRATQEAIASASLDRDEGGHATGDPVAAERKEA